MANPTADPTADPTAGSAAEPGAELQRHKRYRLALCAVLAPVLLYLGNPALALIVAASLSLLLQRPLVQAHPMLVRYTLQAAIVLLGLRLNVETVWTLSAEYGWAVAACVVFALALGLALVVLLRCDAVTGRLLTAGTAICGATAIATLSPLLGSRPHQTGVALAIVFLLNAVALLAFPYVGGLLGLSELQFGLWSALAIHDTSSVVATASIYGDHAAEVAATVKLGRTLWLIPLVFVAGLLSGQGSSSARFPLFVVMFVLASVFGTLAPLPEGVYSAAGWLSKSLLVAALFLVGTEMTRQTLAQIRGSVLVHALSLWLSVVLFSLGVVYWMTRAG
jgi:uncharacterized membrane protein YadS